MVASPPFLFKVCARDGLSRKGACDGLGRDKQYERDKADEEQQGLLGTHSLSLSLSRQHSPEERLGFQVRHHDCQSPRIPKNFALEEHTVGNMHLAERIKEGTAARHAVGEPFARGRVQTEKEELMLQESVVHRQILLKVSPDFHGPCHCDPSQHLSPPK